MPNTERILIEFDSHDGSLQSTVYLSTGQGFLSKSTDTPASTAFLPLVKDAGNLNTYLFKEASTSGFAKAVLGNVRLNNANGGLNYLEDRGLGGFNITIRQEQTTSSAYPGDFPIRISGAIAYPEFTSYYTDLFLKDRTSLFRDKQYQPHKYSGDNNGSSIELEGKATDIGGLPKPVLLGSAKNLTPVMVNEAKEIFQISSEPVAEIAQVYVGRTTTTTIGTVQTSLSTFLSTSPSAGTVDVYYGDYTAADGANERGCYIRFGTTPSHSVTVDAIEGWKNLALYSEEFDNAAWSKTNITVTANSTAAPDGNTTADTLTASAGNGTCLQTVTASSSDYIHGIWLKRKTGTGDIDLTVDGGSTWETKSITTSWVFYEVTEQTVSNPQFGVRIVTSGDEVYVWGGMCCQRDECGPYVKTTSGAAYNNHIPALLWKILDKKGYTLDAESIAVAQAQFAHHAQHWQGASEILTGDVIDLVKDSALFYLTNDINGNYITKQLTLPTSGESVATLQNTQILGGEGSPKIKKIPSRDADRGLPVHKVIIQYDENYTVMTKQELTGAADTLDELAYVSNQFRSTKESSHTDSSVLTQYPNSPEKIKLSKLIDKTGADAQAAAELAIFKVRRPIIEIKIPIEFAIKSDGTLIQKGEVIQVDSKYYRIIGQKMRLKSSDRSEVTAGAITFQAWGGVS
jgi:pSer/pThr/pTyr-binding forkhead associated (FHA) protein